MMIVAIFMFSMSVGFTLQASGRAYQKNSFSIMADYVLIICFVAVIFFFTGHTLIQSADGGIIGSTDNIDMVTNREMEISLTKQQLDDSYSRLVVFVNTFSAVMIAMAQM